MKFLSVHTVDPHLFWIMNSSGQNYHLLTFYIRVSRISVGLHKLSVPWNNVLALLGERALREPDVGELGGKNPPSTENGLWIKDM